MDLEDTLQVSESIKVSFIDNVTFIQRLEGAVGMSQANTWAKKILVESLDQGEAY